MGTKYSTILVGGVVQTYKDDASITDDGSQTDANRVKYSTITTDLTTPLHSAITRMDGLLATHVDEGPVTKSINFTTTATEHNKCVECSGTITISLLNPSGNAGYQTVIKNAGTGVTTVDVDGGANVDGVSSVTLSAGESMRFRVNAAGTAYFGDGLHILDEDNMSSDSDSHLATQQSIKKYVDDNDTLAAQFCTNTNGNPNISDTVLDIGALTETTWNEIGTGQWAALSSVTAGANWIEVKFVSSILHATDSLSRAWARKAGASDPAAGANNVVFNYQSPSTGAGNAVVLNTMKIPISASRAFDIYWESNATAFSLSAYLIGYGWN